MVCVSFKTWMSTFDAFCSMALHTLPFEGELLLNDLLLTTECGRND